MSPRGRWVVLFALICATIALVVWNGRVEAVVPVAGGRTTYLRDCAICHGANGEGTGNGPSLKGVGRAAVDYYVTTGRMPLVKAARSTTAGRTKELAPGSFAVDPDASVSRHASSYTSDEMRAVIDYASNLTESGPDITSMSLEGGDVSAGGEFFRLNCAACHSWAGEGGALLDRAAPNLGASTARQTAEAIRVGPGQMPAFGSAALNDQQVADVVAYVRSLQHPHDPGGSALWHLGPVAEGAVALIVGLGAIGVFIRWIGERG